MEMDVISEVYDVVGKYVAGFQEDSHLPVSAGVDRVLD